MAKSIFLEFIVPVISSLFCSINENFGSFLKISL